jgi:hypothetical protein
MSLGAGRTIIVYQPDDSHSVIDLLLVSHLEVAQRAAPPMQDANGDQ